MADSRDPFRIIVIDDDRTMRDSLRELLTAAGWRVEVLHQVDRLDAMVASLDPDVILSDVQMPGMDGMTLLRGWGGPDAAPMVLISAHGDIPMAVEAMGLGAYSFLEKPYDARRLLKLLSNAAERHRLSLEGARLRSRLAQLSGLDRVLLGETAAIRSVRRQVLELVDADASVLLQGETGTGKEVVARALHDLSTRAEAPFVAISCAAIAPGDFERFMFGTVSGEPGAFERARGGTLFLDEIATLPAAQQAGLLRAIETRERVPVGGSGVIDIALRVVSATNAPLDDEVEAGRFRADLYYRINTMMIDLPGLRERQEDIPLLFERFLTELGALYEMTPPTTTPDDLSALLSHGWPGNVRELRHVAERRILAARQGRGSVAEALRREPQVGAFPVTLREATAAFEREMIARTLVAEEGRMDAAAETLGIGRRTLNEKIVKLGLDKDALF